MGKRQTKSDRHRAYPLLKNFGPVRGDAGRPIRRPVILFCTAMPAAAVGGISIKNEDQLRAWFPPWNS